MVLSVYDCLSEREEFTFVVLQCCILIAAETPIKTGCFGLFICPVQMLRTIFVKGAATPMIICL